MTPANPTSDGNLTEESDWRDVDHSWYSLIERSGPGGLHNEQPTIAIADDGAWICAWTQGPREAAIPLEIVARRSCDRGQTWESIEIIEPADGYRIASYSYVYKSSINGRVFCFYRYNHHGATIIRPDACGEVFFRFSDDNGKTWSSKRCIIPTRKTSIDDLEGEFAGWFCGQGPVEIDGNLWIPGTKHNRAINNREVWFWVSPNALNEPDPERLNWYNKPDGDRGIGASYHPNWEEACIVSLKDDVLLYSVMRTRTTGFLGQSWSSDGGDTWAEGSAAEYWNGSGELNNPKVGPSLTCLSDGTYLLLFYNDRGEEGIPWYELFDRSPLWCSVGWIDGNVLKFSQPEILLYNDLDTSTSAEGNRSSIHAPYVFESDGSVYVVYANKKTNVQITEIPRSMIQGLRDQRTASRAIKAGLVYTAESRSGLNLNAPVTRWFGESISSLHIASGDSFALEFWLETQSKSEEGLMNRYLFDSSDSEGAGLRCYIDNYGRYVIEIMDLEGNTIQAKSDADYVISKSLQHVVFNVDGLSDVITIIVDGRISGFEKRKNFIEMFHSIRKVNMLGAACIGRSFHHVPNETASKDEFVHVLIFRAYNRYLRTSEVIASYRYGSSFGK